MSAVNQSNEICVLLLSSIFSRISSSDAWVNYSERHDFFIRDSVQCKENPSIGKIFTIIYISTKLIHIEIRVFQEYVSGWNDKWHHENWLHYFLRCECIYKRICCYNLEEISTKVTKIAKIIRLMVWAKQEKILVKKLWKKGVVAREKCEKMQKRF